MESLLYQYLGRLGDTTASEEEGVLTTNIRRREGEVARVSGLGAHPLPRNRESGESAAGQSRLRRQRPLISMLILYMF